MMLASLYLKYAWYSYHPSVITNTFVHLSSGQARTTFLHDLTS